MTMSTGGKIGYLVFSIGAILLGVGVSTVAAETITSPNYKINGNLGGSFGGQTDSTNYKMTSIGGEAIVGSGSSTSYIIDQQVTNATAQTMQLTVQPGGLVGYYPMDENMGTTTADASQYQNNGTFNTSAAWQAPGKIGNAADINGTTGPEGGGEGAVLIPDNSNLPSGSAMTIEAWVKQDAYTGGRTIASHWFHDGGGPTNDPSWALETDHEHIIMYVANGQGDIGLNRMETSEAPWGNYGTWRHIAAVYDGTLPEADRVKIYLDGVLMATHVYGTVSSSLRNASGNFSIGSIPGYNSAFNGSIDHVKLFNRALTAAEITAEYEAQNNGIATGLSLGAVTSESTTMQADAIVRTNVTDYTLAAQQDHDLQNSGDFIPAISGSVSSPATWSDGVTKGLGFTLTGAPTLDGKWGSGTKYAALPISATTFYNGTGNVNGVIDVINLRYRLDVTSSQPVGTYSNNITYTGTITP